MANVLLTASEAAGLIRVSERTVRRAINKGNIKAERLEPGNTHSPWRVDFNALKKQYKL